MNQRKRTFSVILIALSITLLILPLVTTFNEILTVVVERSPVYRTIQRVIVPGEVRLVGALLSPLGMKPSVSEDTLFLEWNGNTTGIYISWNCIGWQSLVLFIITLFTGLQGPYTALSKFECIAVGLLGTVWINILRIALVSSLAVFMSQPSAIIFHDYGATLLTIAWLMMFWWLSFRFILEPQVAREPEKLPKRLRRKIGN
jgi:exosortase/archaeosortase family protein